METDHFEQTMRAFLNRSPFRPFTIVLVNGDRFEVDHRDAVVVREGVAAYIGPGGAPVIFDHEGVNEFIDDLMEQPNTG